MKNGKDSQERTRNAVSLQQVLADVEHAGRDACRRQELSEMIDRMAGMEIGKRKEEKGRSRSAWWWVLRVAAAACVLFFITTAVRIWFIPTEPAGTMVAEAEVPAPPQRLPNDFSTTSQRLPNDYRGGRGKVVEKPQKGSFAEDEAEVTVMEEVLVDNEVVEETVDTAEELLVVDNDIAPEPEEPQVDAEPEQPLQPVPAEPVAAKLQERKSSLLGGLLRRAEPSKMDGTMLAINIL